MYHRSLENFFRINNVVPGFTNCIFGAPSQHWLLHSVTFMSDLSSNLNISWAMYEPVICSSSANSKKNSLLFLRLCTWRRMDVLQTLKRRRVSTGHLNSNNIDRFVLGSWTQIGGIFHGWRFQMLIQQWTLFGYLFISWNIVFLIIIFSFVFIFAYTLRVTTKSKSLFTKQMNNCCYNFRIIG